jgi:hypothetical protein
MATRRNKITKRNRTRSRRMKGGKKSKTGKKWTTAIDAASHTLEKTGSISAAKKSLKKQALFNARKLFGSVGV